jgi:hypothetical protein
MWDVHFELKVVFRAVFCTYFFTLKITDTVMKKINTNHYLISP